MSSFDHINMSAHGFHGLQRAMAHASMFTGNVVWVEANEKMILITRERESQTPRFQMMEYTRSGEFLNTRDLVATEGAA
jgi:hypothetical protein